MAQVTIYLPEDLARQVRKRAEEARKSVSAYICELLLRETSSGRWPEDLVDLLQRGGADLVEPEDPPPEELGSLG